MRDLLKRRCANGKMLSVPLVVPAKAGTHNLRIPIDLPACAAFNRPMYYVYLLASGKHGTLYVGVTNSIRHRLDQHRAGTGSEFVKKYQIFKLVHLEAFNTPQDAIGREKQIKNWKRDWKIRLIEQDNPQWDDLSHLIV